MDLVCGASRRCDGCGGGMRAADATFGAHGELLCDGCAPAVLASDGPTDRSGSWAAARLLLVGVALLVGYLLTR